MKIGLLLPRSVLYPSISFDIMDGLKECLHKMKIQNSCQVISASIGIAGKNEEIYARCEQLLLDGADIIVGYMNPLSAEYINSLFTGSGKLLLVLDSGYHFPLFKGKLLNTYFISLQGSLCCHAIVSKAIEDGCRDFTFTGSFYDAGYRPPYVYSSAVEEREAVVSFNYVTPLRKSEFTLAPLSQHLTKNKETALLVSFSGDMAEDFFRESKQIYQEVPYKAYGAGFTAEELWLDKISYPGYDWNCVVPWSINIDTTENNEFVQAMKKINSHKANIFSLLGWEAALFIKKIEEEKSLDGITIKSPRGNLYLNTDNGFTEAPLYSARVLKNEKTGNCFLADIIKISDLSVERDYLLKDIVFIQNTTANSWLNAYPCLDS